ncbi:magnesium transporter [Desulfosalsimonas propionicica]|uniref:Magnesium transport protein CorA n=1 Tax=Desulfosalsimonas propionicica TaxID=332175 RepID=A0A7W0HK35_9BACT|nr:magnesium/cobalt transporter CorA [Desulfosalsimonas propionicica]MBA2880758.1 magnesium transporter [Desulfosalsimonas propionicica]
MASEKVSTKIGMAPGSLVYVGEEGAADICVSIIQYSRDRYTETTDADLEACRQAISEDSVTWINITGVHDPDLIGRLGQMFDLHPLVLEDMLNTEGRPKLDDYDTYLFAILKMIDYDPGQNRLDHEQVSLVVRPGLVISLQEKPGDVFDPVRERIRKGKGRIRKLGADYLAYALMDMIVDQYFLAMEQIGEQIEDLQDEVIEDPGEEIVQTIHQSRSRIIFLKKAVWPVREIIHNLLRDDTDLISDDVRVYLRDVYDHAIHVSDTVESHRDILSGVLDIYLTTVSNRMNEVMKVLTVIATIFIPLTFIAGVYGMNFDYMPELSRPWAYPALWAVFLGIFAGLLVWFKRRKWL